MLSKFLVYKTWLIKHVHVFVSLRCDWSDINEYFRENIVFLCRDWSGIHEYFRENTRFLLQIFIDEHWTLVPCFRIPSRKIHSTHICVSVLWKDATLAAIIRPLLPPSCDIWKKHNVKKMKEKKRTVMPQFI